LTIISQSSENEGLDCVRIHRKYHTLLAWLA
jgi:hypothetical protein